MTHFDPAVIEALYLWAAIVCCAIGAVVTMLIWRAAAFHSLGY